MENTLKFTANWSINRFKKEYELDAKLRVLLNKKTEKRFFDCDGVTGKVSDSWKKGMTIDEVQIVKCQSEEGETFLMLCPQGQGAEELAAY